jgi:hypothetical protein
MHGVGIFENIKILERQRLLFDTTWTTATASGGAILIADMLLALANEASNLAVLKQFNFIRGGIELTVRLNTNQFYYGALAATLIPPGTGFRLDERMMQSPTTISASSAESVIKEWKYSVPFEWLPLVNILAATGLSGQFPVVFALDVLCPLTTSTASAPTTITVQVWARFIDLELSYPTAIEQTSITSTNFIAGPTQRLANVEKQSKVMIPRPSGSKHPNLSSNSTEDSALVALDSLEHITLGDAISHLPGVSTLFNALSFLVDKPDKTEEQTVIVSDHNVDMWNIDTPDINTSTGLHRGRYSDPAVSRIPMSSNMTLSQFAQIPGILSDGDLIPNFVFHTNGDTTGPLALINVHPDNSSMKTPLDYAALNAIFYRGSLKVMLQFFTSSFISGRMVVQYHNYSMFAATPESSEYDSTLSRVINVKGDTTDTFQLPFLHPYSWVNSRSSPGISVTLDSVIASTDTTATPNIYMIVWIAGGEDIQFAGPRRIQYNTEWSSAAPTVEKQAMIHEMFKEKFSPIVENCRSDIDNAYATTEQIGSMSDLAKRYSMLPLQLVTTPVVPAGWDPEIANTQYNIAPTTMTIQYLQYAAFRQTLYGQMRSAFLYSCGGYRFRRVCSGLEFWALECFNDLAQGTYTTTHDGMLRMTVPYNSVTPYTSLGYLSSGYKIVPDPDNSSSTPTFTASTPQWLAARDDVMFGWPCLPKGMTIPQPAAQEEKINLRKSRGKGKERT